MEDEFLNEFRKKFTKKSSKEQEETQSTEQNNATNNNDERNKEIANNTTIPQISILFIYFLSFFSGTFMTTSVPLPTSLFISMLPPLASIISFAIGRPSPVPPISLERALSTR